MLVLSLQAGRAGAASEAVVTTPLGDIRVQALSRRLVRVEPRGPMGFEDRTTFVVRNRTMGEEVEVIAEGSVVRSDSFEVEVTGRWTDPGPTCGAPATEVEVAGGVPSFSLRA